MKSSGTDEVVESLRNTRKGKLKYGSAERGQHFLQNRARPTGNDINNSRPVISLRSPPDERNSESFFPFYNDEPFKQSSTSQALKDDIVKDKSRISHKFPRSNSSDSANNCFEKGPKQELHVSNYDVLDLIENCKAEIEEKARNEVKSMRTNFLTGLQTIQRETKNSKINIDRFRIAKFNAELNDVDTDLVRTKSKGEETLKQLKKQHENRSMIISTFNENIKKRQEQISKERKLQEDTIQQRKTLCKMIDSSMINIRAIVFEIKENLEPQNENVYLSDEIKPVIHDINSIYLKSASLAKNALESQKLLEQTNSFLKKAEETLIIYKEKVAEKVSKAISKKKEDEEKKEGERKAVEAKLLEAKKLEEEQKKQLQAKEKNASTFVSFKDGQEGFVSEEAFKMYKEKMEFRQQTVAAYSALIDQKEKKAYRFDLTKAINTPINAISDQSPDHLMDKIARITKLLKGETIEVGSKKISCKDQPEGLAYCQDTIAKKLVLQGAQQIASSFNSAFSFGAVALGIWSQFPEIGNLMLAHFYTACPYLVPYYILKRPEQSTAEYCKILGYEVNGEEVETEDKYLKKLSGIVRLYAAIVQSPMPPSLSSMGHPCGLHNGWTWLSRIMNLEPRETVTATVLFDFLEVAGYAMSKQYGKQFQKLLQNLCQGFLPKIDDVTASDQKGPVMRLKMFLEKCLKSGIFPVPDGYISSRWWSTSSNPY